jgi:hypothetical protein
MTTGKTATTDIVKINVDAAFHKPTRSGGGEQSAVIANQNFVLQQ